MNGGVLETRLIVYKISLFLSLFLSLSLSLSLFQSVKQFNFLYVCRFGFFLLIYTRKERFVEVSL